MILTYILLFIIGLVIGSFLNVVIFRLPDKVSIVKEPSSCRVCKEKLKYFDLIPVLSFFILKGQCRSCGASISWQYPVVEFLTGLAFVFVPWFHGVTDITTIDILVVRDLLFFAALLVIFITDLKHYLIFDAVTYPLMLAALIINTFNSPDFYRSFLMLLMAALIGGGFFALQYIISGGKWIGLGDAKLGILMGLMLNWPYILVAIFLAYILGSVISIGLLILGQKKFGSKMPMGVFLTTSTMITLLYGPDIISWYLSLLNK